MMHVLTGLPRSGSSLLADLLNDHPDIHVSGTSALSPAVGVLSEFLGQSEEVQGDLANDLANIDHYRDAMRGLITGWYAHRDEPVTVDKGRLWLSLWHVALDLDPDAQMIVCVRDPREVVASIERAHRATGLFPAINGDTLEETVANLMGPRGMVGGPMRFIEDLIRRQLPGVNFVSYGSLVADHHRVLAHLAKHLGLAEHDWPDEVTERGYDNDGISRGKFTHRTAGPVQLSGGDWHRIIDIETAQRIAVSYPLYMQTFGY